MIPVFIRFIRVLPVLAVIALVVAVLYGVLSATSTRERARRVTISVLTVVFGALTVVSALITLYAWVEGNVHVLELADVSAILFGLCLCVTRLIAWRMRVKANAASSDGSAR